MLLPDKQPGTLRNAPGQDILLAEEGYSVVAVVSLLAALDELHKQVFDLILADVVGWRSEEPLGAVDALRAQAAPTPVALVTGWKLDDETIKARGFAGLISKPFDLNDLLAQVAECIERPLTPEQERQAEVARRYCAGIDAHDWAACVALCREEVRYYPSANSLFDRKQEVIGRAALLEQFAHNQTAAPDFHYESCYFYGRPEGIAARYLATIAAPEGRRRFAGSFLFQFAGEQIAQIDYRLDA
jgi:DNA-binding response OmpR family regulator